MLQEKRMVARIPADPKHCPKCSSALVEHEEPENFHISGGNVVSSGQVLYSCPACGITWAAHLIPDHYLYDPEMLWCPECGSEEKRELDTIPYGLGTTTTYQCLTCGSYWRQHSLTNSK